MITMELNLPKEKRDEFGYTKSQRRQIEKELTKPKKRFETTMERINRIGYEYGEKGFEKKPPHMDDKNVISFEDQEIFENNINKKNKKVVDKPKPNKPKPIPFPSNAQEFQDITDWLEILDPGGWTSEEDKRAQVEENLFEKYLELLKAGELLPGTSFEMFEKTYDDYDTDLISKINRKVLENKKKEGLPTILGISSDRI